MSVENKINPDDDNDVENNQQDIDKNKGGEEIETLLKNQENLVEEIKQVRKERAEARAEAELLKKKLEEETPSGNSEDKETVESIVKKVLEQKESTKVLANKQKAFDAFVASHKEFLKGNDPAGLKRQALERKFNLFNTSKLTEVQEFMEVIKDSASLLGIVDTDSKTHKETDYNPYSSTPEGSPSPSITDSISLTEKERKVVKEKGWTEEEYLKKKQAHPEFIKGLLAL